VAASQLDYILKYPNRLAGAVLRDPMGLWDTFQDRLVQNREYKRPAYRCAADPNWETTLQNWLGLKAFDPRAEFAALWPQVVESVRSQGIDVGPASYAGFNDGDAALVRAIWYLVRHLKPTHVVETGVAHGFTSRFILEALAANGQGALYSIDRPPLDEATRARIGIAVGNRHSRHWTLIRKSSRRALPSLVKQLEQIDLFVHDSLHTERNGLFELNQIWPALRSGGVAVIDDVDSNWGFDHFTKTHSGFRALVCEAEPVRPDERRFNNKGLFAILVKD
jgi:hypothetical protein